MSKKNPNPWPRARERVWTIEARTAGRAEYEAIRAKSETEAERIAEAHYRSVEVLIVHEDLADAFEALDDWLSKGGFLPKGWSDASKTCGGA